MKLRKILILIFCIIQIISISVLATRDKVEAKFNRIVDGDTAKFEIEGELVTVRFVGINTPEIAHDGDEAEPYGVEASNFTNEKLKNAKKIELEFDENAGETDRYDRTLAWIWIDGELLQDLIIKEGLGTTKYLKDNYKYANQLKLSEENAKANNIGLWSGEQPQTEIKKEEIEKKEDSFTISNISENDKKIIAITCGIIAFLYIMSKVKISIKNKITKEKWRKK